MTNIIDFVDKKKQKIEVNSSKEEMLKVLESLKQMIDEDKLTGFVAVAVGSDEKIFSSLAGNFDIIHVIGGFEVVKHFLLTNSDVDDEDD